jgi:aspartyl-tRNA(Asn)/glutamyl-tRNA(Gln) amidotransferase subunit A
MNIAEAGEALRKGQFSSVELTTAALARVSRLNSSLRAFITVTADAALARAMEADAEFARGVDRGPLHGLPMAVKDLFFTRGVLTTAGSLLYKDFVPDHDAAVIERLEKAGAVLIGKLNMHELAYGITSANPHFGAVRNPWNVEHSPGGSSGGSGAAVASGMVYAAMGSDTGGSIRIPASFCGTVGLKPTYGRVSRFGAFPLSWSLDHMGPLTRCVRDAAIVFDAIAGHDPRDAASSRHPVTDTVPDAGCSIRGVRIGFPENFFFDRLDPDVESSVRGAFARAQAIGAVIVPVRLPDMEAVAAVGRIILLCEASAMMEPHFPKRSQIGPDVLALLDQGRLLPATDYIQAQRLRKKMQREFAAIWKNVDCLLAPATPTAAPKIGQDTVRLGGREEDVRILTTRLVRGFNVLGLPSLSMPCGLTAAGLPVGLQVVAPPMEEALVLRVGAALEDSGVSIPPCPTS